MGFHTGTSNLRVKFNTCHCATVNYNLIVIIEIPPNIQNSHIKSGHNERVRQPKANIGVYGWVLPNGLWVFL